LALPVLVALVFSVLVSLGVSHPIGVDWHFHRAIAEQYAAFDFGGAWNIFYGENHSFYPPLFHWLLVPSVWLGCVDGFGLLLQCLLYPLCVACFVWLVNRYVGFGASFWGALVLLGSVAFRDRLLQPQPQGLDFILWLFAAGLFLAGHKMREGWLCVSVLGVFNHGLVSLSFLVSMVWGQMKRKDCWIVHAFAVATFVVIVISLYTLAGGLGNYGPRIDTDQELYFYRDPVGFWVSYVGLPTLGFFVGGYSLVKRRLDALGKLCVLTVAATSVMVLVWPDRWAQYSVMPLTILLMQFFSRQSFWPKVFFATAIFGFFVVRIMINYFLLTHGGFQT